MLDNLKKISQSGIRELLKERLENPEKYVNKSLIIWRSHLYDGIQDYILRIVCHDFNRNKERRDKRWFKEVKIKKVPATKFDEIYGMLSGGFAEIEQGKKDSTVRIGLLVVETSRVFNDKQNETRLLEILHSVINKRMWGSLSASKNVPIICFMSQKYWDIDVPDNYPMAEQYIFKPDFKEFEEEIRQLQRLPDFLIDFLKSKPNHDKRSDIEESTYRWYNYFNYSGVGLKGCDFPECWFDTFKKLKMALKCSRQEKFSNLVDLDFKYYISDGISDDLKEEFRNYIIENNL